MGTDTKMDTPEAITAWLEDRKKWWPSAKQVMEKVTFTSYERLFASQSRQEALERGQILTESQ